MHTPSHSSPLRRTGLLLVQLALTGAVTWFILRSVGVGAGHLLEFRAELRELRWGFLLLASFLLLGGYLYLAALWGRMVVALGGSPVPLLPSLRVFFTANLGRYLPGKLWQVAGLAYLARGEGVEASTAMAAALLGQAFALAGAAVVGAGVLLFAGPLPGGGGALASVLLAALLLVLGTPPLLRPLLALWFRLARGSPPERLAVGAAFGLRWMALYALGWVLQGTAFWLLVLGLGMGVPLLWAAPAYCAAYLLGYLAFFAPAGIGVREGFLILLLEPVLGAGGAGLAAVAARLWSTLLELLPALLLARGYLRGSREGRGDE